MSDAWRVASIDSFERVSVAETSALLRVAASSAVQDHTGEVDPELVVDDGLGGLHRFAALPAPPNSGGLLRCAYSVPAAVLSPAVRYRLEFLDGFAFTLPEPTSGVARRRSATPSDDGETDATSADAGTADQGPLSARSRLLRLHLEAAEGRAEQQALRELLAHASSVTPSSSGATAELADERARHNELRDRFTELQRRAHETHDRLLSLEQERDAARADASTAQAHADARVSELEIWSGELERRLSQVTLELAAARDGAEATTEPVAVATGPRTATEADLASIREAAIVDAHRAAERDLAQAVPGSAG